MSVLKWISYGTLRLYMQFIIILAIAFLFSLFLNPIFDTDENNIRIMSSAIFLSVFTVALTVLGSENILKFGKKE